MAVTEFTTILKINGNIFGKIFSEGKQFYSVAGAFLLFVENGVAYQGVLFI